MGVWIVLTTIIHGICGLSVYDGDTLLVSAIRTNPGKIEVSWVGRTDTAYRFQPRACEKPNS